MKSVGIIPLRRDSKGIPGKNKRKVLGRPLFSWVLTEAILSNLDEIYIFTNDDEIGDFVTKEYVWTNKVKVLKRSEETANDTSSTEETLSEFIKILDSDFELLCLLQATSPLLKCDDINNGLAIIKSQKYSSIVSVVESHRFFWDENGNPINYNPAERPRRQAMLPQYMENGAIYITSLNAFKNSGVRISGIIGLLQMPEETGVEIDSETDFKIVEQLLIENLKTNKKNEKIKTLVLDVDGVFTDGGIYYTQKGEASLKFDRKDGMGLELLRKSGVEVMVITSENSEIVKQRMKKLQLKKVFLGVKDKYGFLNYWIRSHNIDWEEVAYIGDDVNDLAGLCASGWSFAPSNAILEVKYNVDEVLKNGGGNGCIREACELIIDYNRKKIR